MPDARIYQRPKSSTQSGRSGTDLWVLEYISSSAVEPDPLTGWNGRADTQSQVQLSFPTLEAAQAYADRKGVRYHLVPAPGAKLKLQAYADNFR